MQGWRTMVAAGVVALLGVLQGLDWVAIVTSPKSFGWTAVGFAALMAVFRAITSTPIGTPPST
jgi:hypothetical protein